MRVQLPLKPYAQFSKASKPSMGALHHPAMLAQFLAAFNTTSCDAAEDSTLSQVRPAAGVVVALVCVKLVGPPARAALQSFDCRYGVYTRLQCRLAPLTKTTNGMPWASTMMCRLEPSLPLSVGLGPVSWPPGGLAPKSHQCWPGSNQFGHVREGEQAWLGAVAPRHLQHSSHANAANTSCRCRSPKLEASLPMQCQFGEQTRCH